MTANSWESGLFILFLVVFAVIAAGYVLKKVKMASSWVLRRLEAYACDVVL